MGRSYAMKFVYVLAPLIVLVTVFDANAQNGIENELEELPALFSTIQKYVLSPGGFQNVRDFARWGRTKHPIVNFFKLYVNGENDANLRAILGDLFKDTTFFDDAPPAGDVRASLKRTRDILNTPEGVKLTKNFAQGVKSNYQFVNQFLQILRSVNDYEIKHVIKDLFNGLIGKN